MINSCKVQKLAQKHPKKSKEIYYNVPHTHPSLNQVGLLDREPAARLVLDKVPPGDIVQLVEVAAPDLVGLDLAT